MEGVRKLNQDDFRKQKKTRRFMRDELGRLGAS